MDNQQSENIEKYLLGTLSSESKIAFERQLEEDADLREKLASTKLVIEATKSRGLELELKEIHKELYHEKPVSKRLYWTLGIAASIILILTFFFILSNSGNEKNLFQQYFSPFPDYITSRESKADGSWEKGMQFYTNRDYTKAIDHFKKSNIPNEHEADLLFYKGVSYLAVGNSQEAMNTFSELEIKSDKYKEQIKWYVALAYLSSNEKSSAILALKTINKGEYEYGRAQELLVVLD